MISSSTLHRSLLRGGMQTFSRQARSISTIPVEQKIVNMHLKDTNATNQMNKSTQAAVPDISSYSDTKGKSEIKSKSWITKRFQIMGEVTVSKIFPAGFGWQSASLVAENQLGYACGSLPFNLMTGLGDGLGVFLGHCSFYGIKKMVTGNEKILMKREVDNGILLGSAAFCSGSAWQPLVDTLQLANLSFSGVFAGTWIGCGTAFYFGLRAGRTLLPNFLEYVDECSYENSKTDASLSIAIGSATGFFVGTDALYLPDQNFLIDLVGIPDGTPDLKGCIIAGTSTSLGFGATQSVFNVIYPKDKCWND